MAIPNTTTPRDALIGALLVLVASIAFSSKAIMVKLAYAYDVNAETLIALRMAFAAPFFFALALWTHILPGAPAMTTRDRWSIVALGSVGGYGPMWLDFAGLEYVTAGLERVILFLYPTMVVVISALLFGQRIGRREVFALLVSYLGVALAVGHDLTILKSGTGQTLLGAALILASALSYAGYLVASGYLIPRVGSSAFTAYIMLTVGIASGVHFTATQNAASIMHLPMPVYALGLLMAVVATVLPAIMLNIGIHRIGSSRASLVSSIGPVSTILLAWIFLGEGVTAIQLAGTALVMIGVLAITVKPTSA